MGLTQFCLPVYFLLTQGDRQGASNAFCRQMDEMRLCCSRHSPGSPRWSSCCKAWPPALTRLSPPHIWLLLFTCLVMFDSLRPHELQHARLLCPSPSPEVYSNSCPLSWWCHPTISSSVVPFSSCPLSFPASGSFPMSRLFASGGQRTGVSTSASVLPMNTQDWFPLGWTGWISLLSKGLSRVFSSNTVRKHQFLGAQPCLYSNSHMHML